MGATMPFYLTPKGHWWQDERRKLCQTEETKPAGLRDGAAGRSTSRPRASGAPSRTPRPAQRARWQPRRKPTNGWSTSLSAREPAARSCWTGSTTTRRPPPQRPTMSSWNTTSGSISSRSSGRSGSAGSRRPTCRQLSTTPSRPDWPTRR